MVLDDADPDFNVSDVEESSNPKTRRFYDEAQEKVAVLSQPVEDSTQPQPINMNKLPANNTSEVEKRRVIGTGHINKTYASSNGSCNSTATSSIDEHEITRRVDEKVKERVEAMRGQMRAEMWAEMLAEMWAEMCAKMRAEMLVEMRAEMQLYFREMMRGTASSTGAGSVSAADENNRMDVNLVEKQIVI